MNRRDLGDGEADTGLNRVGHLIGLQAEYRSCGCGVADGRAGGLVEGGWGDVVGAADVGGRLARAQSGGDLLGRLAVRRGQGDEGARLRLAQRVFLELEALADAVFRDRRVGRSLRRKQNHRHHAELGRAQTVGVLLDEGVQLGVSRGGDLTGHRRGNLEPTTVAAFEGGTGQQRAIDARHAGAGEDGGAEMLRRVLVAQVLLQHGGGQVLLRQSRLISLLVELSGDRVEEGRDLADLLDDQLLSRADARLVGPVQEAQLLRLLGQEADVNVFRDQLLVRQGTADLLLQPFTHLIESCAELDFVHRAVARVDDVFRSQVGEDIHPRADDHEADRDQDE